MGGGCGGIDVCRVDEWGEEEKKRAEVGELAVGRKETRIRFEGWIFCRREIGFRGTNSEWEQAVELASGGWCGVRVVVRAFGGGGVGEEQKKGESEEGESEGETRRVSLVSTEGQRDRGTEKTEDRGQRGWDQLDNCEGKGRPMVGNGMWVMDGGRARTVRDGRATAQSTWPTLLSCRGTSHGMAWITGDGSIGTNLPRSFSRP